MPLLTTFLYIVFVLSAIVLITVILLQEGRGGGLGSALGSGGQQAFGPGAKGINQFTAIVAAVFLSSALAITMFNTRASRTVLGNVEAVGPGAAEAPAGGSPSAPAGQ
jgi:preprotein translocase subunit SecG